MEILTTPYTYCRIKRKGGREVRGSRSTQQAWMTHKTNCMFARSRQAKRISPAKPCTRPHRAWLPERLCTAVNQIATIWGSRLCQLLIESVISDLYIFGEELSNIFNCGCMFVCKHDRLIPHYKAVGNGLNGLLDFCSILFTKGTIFWGGCTEMFKMHFI